MYWYLIYHGDVDQLNQSCSFGSWLGHWIRQLLWNPSAIKPGQIQFSHWKVFNLTQLSTEPMQAWTSNLKCKSELTAGAAVLNWGLVQDQLDQVLAHLLRNGSDDCFDLQVLLWTDQWHSRTGLGLCSASVNCRGWEEVSTKDQKRKENIYSALIPLLFFQIVVMSVNIMFFLTV